MGNLKEQKTDKEFIKECKELRKQGIDDEQWDIATKLGEACERLANKS